MRILHTSDWHVGKTLYRHRRLDEAREVLAEIVDIAEHRAVDAVLVCGDVFDRAAPSAEAEEIVYDTLVGFEEREIPVLLLTGNHDHPKRWAALKPLLSRFDVKVVPDVLHPNKGGIVHFPARDHSTELQVAVLPWVSERHTFGARELMGLRGETHQIYADDMALLIEALCTPLDSSVCTAFAGHLFVSGASPGEAQRPLTIGRTYAVAPQALPEVQYAALGHVHRPQPVPHASRPAYYSGSPLQLDFGEVTQKKSVNIVDLRPGEPAEVRTEPITRGRRLREVSGTYDELAAQKDAHGDDWLLVKLHCRGPRPGLGDQVRELLPHALSVKPVYPRAETPMGVRRIRGLTPREQYAHYLREKEDAEPEEDDLNLFESLLDEVTK